MNDAANLSVGFLITGSPVYATNDGIATRAYSDNLTGNTIIVNNGGGLCYFILASFRLCAWHKERGVCQHGRSDWCSRANWECVQPVPG